MDVQVTDLQCFNARVWSFEGVAKTDMRIGDVPGRMAFRGILDEYGLRAIFIRQPSPTGFLEWVNIFYHGGERMDLVVSLSVSEYKKIGFDDLPELCEYWKMLAVFR